MTAKLTVCYKSCVMLHEVIRSVDEFSYDQSMINMLLGYNLMLLLLQV